MKNVHFISIGGSVMHQLAIALKEKGYVVSGSDDEIFEPARSNLEKAGLLPKSIGWDMENIHPGLDEIILGMHAKEDNPELLRARELGLAIYSFPEYIYRESLQKTRIAIGGSHGKTSTTAMVMHVLQKSGRDFDYLVGAKLTGFDHSVKITDAPVIVCEADEYPASTIERRPKFHFLFPHIAVITGIAWDHINVFPTFDFYLEQFVIFIQKIQAHGVLIYNETDRVLRELVESNIRSDIRYIGYHLPAHTITNGITEVRIGDAKTSLQIFGEHNLLNLSAAHYVCKELKMNDSTFAENISDFKGAAKRLEQIYQGDSTNIYRDFAHAPSKVRASIQAVKSQFEKRKLVAVLELHTFSSLNEDFMPQYAGVMDQADVAIVFYSRHALELKGMQFLDPEKVRGGFKKPGLEVINSRKELEARLQQMDWNDTNFLFMSSGTYEDMDIKKTAELAGIGSEINKKQN